nr:VpsF family polysaccharide biosynthesis protein [Devosia oryzisoli]
MGFALAVRINISPLLMDGVFAYTGEGGSFYEKLHLGSYLIFVLLPITLAARPFRLMGDEIGKFRSLFWYMVILTAMSVLYIAMGRAGAIVFVLDSYLVAGAAGIILLALGQEARRALGHFTLVMLIASAIIGIGEAATHHRVLPYGLEELTFRPLGLSEHPLALGALCAMAIGFVPLAQWRLWVRVLAICILLVGCAASGARFALLLAVGELLVLLLVLPWPGLSVRHTRVARLFVLVMTLVGGLILTAILAAGGLLSRFGGTLFDENFFARVTIYEVFGMVGWKEWLFGMPPADLLALVNDRLGLPFIESAQVVIGLTFGVPMALVFTGVILWILWRLLRGAPLAAWIGTGTMILASLSNNTFSAKQPIITLLFTLLLAFPAARSSRGPVD